MIDRITQWYTGTTKVETFDHLNEGENNGSYIAPLVTIEYHWTALVARALVAFHQKKWEFIWGTGIAIVLALATMK